MIIAKPAPNGFSDLGEAHVKGEQGDLSHGPLKRERCTDVLCLVLFVLHVAALWTIAGLALRSGSPWRLYWPRDFHGSYCGEVGQQFGNRSLEAFPVAVLSVNVMEVVGGLAQAAICSKEGKALLSAAVYKEACGSWAAASTSTGLEGITTALQQLTDPSKAHLTMAAGTDGSGLLASGLTMLQYPTRYIQTICTSYCNLTDSATSRTFVFSPLPDVAWARAWQVLMGGQGPGFSAIQAVLSSFQLPAWPESICPYPARFCVPVPGIRFREGTGGLCGLKLSALVTDALGMVETQRLSSESKLSSWEAVESGLGKMAGSVLKTFDLYGAVAALSVIVGLAFMVLVRFFVKPVVWSAIVVVALAWLVFGFLLLLHARQCAGQNLFGFEGFSITPKERDCALYGGFETERFSTRVFFLVLSALCACISVLWVLGTLCLRKRIRLAIAISEVAGSFVHQTPQILIIPLAYVCFNLCWVVSWCVVAAAILSQVPSDWVPSRPFGTKEEALGAGSTPGACNSMWPPGTAYLDTCTLDGLSENSSTAEHLARQSCWRCVPPRAVLDARFVYAVFCLFWHNSFLLAAVQCIIAGAAGFWFFAPKAQKRTQASVVRRATWHTLRYHTGSLAFGSLVLALIKTVKYLLKSLAEQAKLNRNKVLAVIFCALSFVVCLFERCLRFLSQKAYIQVALTGEPFFTSAKHAFYLLMRSWVRFGMLAVLGSIINVVGCVCITLGTGVAGYFLLRAVYPDVDPAAPVIVFLVVGFCVGELFVTVFTVAIDTVLQCFMISEEMDHRDDFIPKALDHFLVEWDLKDSNRHSAWWHRQCVKIQPVH